MCDDGPCDEPDVPLHFSPVWDDTGRAEPLLTGDERTLLTSFLAFHRATILTKCAGLTAVQLREPAVPPSTLSLHGIMRHLAGVERWWFRIQFAGLDLPMLFYTDDDPDQDFAFGPDADAAADLAVLVAEQRAADAVIAAASLDDTGTRRSTGEPVSLRRILVMMIAEYARHTGHADLLRERLDGRTGW